MTYGYDQVTMINSKELDEIEKELALYRFMLEMEKGERYVLFIQYIDYVIDE
ncbi:MAG: hypothetical protein K6B68_09120 [Eubacterium sp.]|nr:hypothetical protein [Eubacterium sp.]